MLRKNWKYILILTLTLALVVTVEWLSPKPINWTATFTRQDKIPFGTYVLFNLLPEIFPGQPIRTANRTLYEEYPDTTEAPSNYLFLNNEFKLGEEDAEVLLGLVSSGSDAFIGAEQFSGLLADTLKLATGFDFKVFTDTFQVNFANPLLRLDEGYSFTRINTPMFFERFDTLRTVVLGVDSLNRPNFIRTQLGKGHFFLHAMPLAFTNYHMLYRNNAEYIAKALSYLPVRSLVWDEHYKLGVGEDHPSPLRFFVQHEPLRWALYLSLLALVLFIVFEAKRKQRIIPIIKPLANTTLEFTETVGRLYYQHKDHKNIAEKKISYLLEFIRSRFYLSTDNRDSVFYEALHRKTGMEKAKVVRLFDVIDHLQRQSMIAEVELLELNQEIEAFYAAVN